MQVILLERVRNLGMLGETVNVKSGYGRNFLIPQGIAVFATADNIEFFEKSRADFEKKAQQLLSKAEQRAAKINDVTITISAQSSDEGKLFGSVSHNEIIDALAVKSIEVDKREIMMPEGPIHNIGQYIVEIHVHSDVVAKLQVEVQPA